MKSSDRTIGNFKKFVCLCYFIQFRHLRFKEYKARVGRLKLGKNQLLYLLICFSSPFTEFIRDLSKITWINFLLNFPYIHLNWIKLNSRSPHTLHNYWMSPSCYFNKKLQLVATLQILSFIENPFARIHKICD